MVMTMIAAGMPFMSGFMILVMCMGSATLAMRRLGDADPAEIF